MLRSEIPNIFPNIIASYPRAESPGKSRPYVIPPADELAGEVEILYPLLPADEIACEVETSSSLPAGEIVGDI